MSCHGASASARAVPPSIRPRQTRLVGGFREWARRKDATPAQVALGWMLARQPRIAPIPGTTSIAHLQEFLGGAALRFTREELCEMDEAMAKLKVVGTRIEPFGERQIDH